MVSILTNCNQTIISGEPSINKIEKLHTRCRYLILNTSGSLFKNLNIKCDVLNIIWSRQ